MKTKGRKIEKNIFTELLSSLQLFLRREFYTHQIKKQHCSVLGEEGVWLAAQGGNLTERKTKMPAIDIGSLMNRLNRTLIQSSKNGTNSIDEDFTNNTEDQDHGKKLINTIFTLVVIGVILLAFPLFTSLACIVRKCCMNRKGFLVDWSRHCYICK